MSGERGQARNARPYSRLRPFTLKGDYEGNAAVRRGGSGAKSGGSRTIGRGALEHTKQQKETGQMNKVFLSGTVESGPKLRLETGKTDQATFRLSAWHRAEDGQWRREVYTICCQDKRAYWAMVNIEAGQRIAVEGTLLGAGQVKIAALEIEYTSGRKRSNVQAEDAQCGTTQETRNDDADEGCEKEEPMETAEQTMELGGAQTEAQTPTLGKAQSNDGIDPRQRKWYDVGKRKGRTEASRARSAQGWNAAPGGKDGDKDGRFSRMGKKLLSMVLALVMVLGMAVCANADWLRSEPYTFWDIPWTSTEEDVRAIVRDKANIELEKQDYIQDQFLLEYRGDLLTLNGVQVQELSFTFEEERLNWVILTFDKLKGEKDIYDALKNTHQKVLESVVKKYGEPTNGSLLVGETYYCYPYLDRDHPSELDYDLVDLAVECKSSLCLFSDWFNITLLMQIEPQGESYTGYVSLSYDDRTLFVSGYGEDRGSYGDKIEIEL